MRTISHEGETKRKALGYRREQSNNRTPSGIRFRTQPNASLESERKCRISGKMVGQLALRLSVPEKRVHAGTAVLPRATHLPRHSFHSGEHTLPHRASISRRLKQPQDCFCPPPPAYPHLRGPRLPKRSLQSQFARMCVRMLLLAQETSVQHKTTYSNSGRQRGEQQRLGNRYTAQPPNTYHPKTPWAEKKTT